MMSIVVDSRDGDQSSEDQGCEDDDRFVDMSAFVKEVEFSCKVEGEVSKTTKGEGRVARREGFEAVLEKVCPGAETGGGEHVVWVGHDTDGCSCCRLVVDLEASIQKVRSWSSYRNLFE